MSVKRKVLEAKTDQELEYYLQENNKFVPQASQFAYEILKLRGRIFTPEDTERITLMIEKKSEEDKIIIHQNHKKAAILIYISATLGIVNMILFPDLPFSFFSIFVAIIVLGFMFGIAYMISKGSNGAKYILLVCMIFGIIYIPFILLTITRTPIVGIISLLQTALQVWAIVLLYQIPKNKSE
ncbi:hypothetical protein [Sphingobacterium kitahiroshimense]|uniref:DUF1129 domain-containing protein n=1 Tax=Sphingobacterium kitahiroshimense TaxID=470446 RepID=A0ABV0BTJ7_9SPHI